MAIRRILILPWGNPRGWKEVEYTYKNRSHRSRTTLPLLHNVLNPYKTVIIALDSLANEPLRP